jgi:excisionase family DNA binding protein
MDYREPEWVAERLGVDKNTLYRFLQDGTIPAIQLGRKWLISEKRLEEWLASETERQTRARREAARSSEAVVRRMDQFTVAARAAIKSAHSEARRYAHEQLDQGHLLLGLAEDGKSSTARVLRKIGLTPETIRRHIEAHLTPGTSPAPRRLARTAEAKRAMRLAARLALRESGGKALSPIGTDHLLMGILLARRGTGYELLMKQNVDRHALRDMLNAAKENIETGDRHGS